jgi:hypothetical protein
MTGYEMGFQCNKSVTFKYSVLTDQPESSSNYLWLIVCYSNERHEEQCIHLHKNLIKKKIINISHLTNGVYSFVYLFNSIRSNGSAKFHNPPMNYTSIPCEGFFMKHTLVVNIFANQNAISNLYSGFSIALYTCPLSCVPLHLVAIVNQDKPVNR